MNQKVTSSALSILLWQLWLSELITCRWMRMSRNPISSKVITPKHLSWKAGELLFLQSHTVLFGCLCFKMYSDLGDVWLTKLSTSLKDMLLLACSRHTPWSLITFSRECHFRLQNKAIATSIIAFRIVFIWKTVAFRQYIAKHHYELQSTFHGNNQKINFSSFRCNVFKLAILEYVSLTNDRKLAGE